MRPFLLSLLLLVASASRAATLEEAARLEADGHLPEARAALEAFWKEHPGDPAGRVRLAHVLISAGDAAAAEPLVKEGLAKAPHDPGLLNELGRLRFNQGKYPEAEGLFEGAAASDTGFIDAIYNVGIARQQAGHIGPAREAFQRALAINPSFLRGLNALGVLEAREKAYPAALDWLHRAEALNAREFDTLYNLGLVLGEMDRHEESAAYFARAFAVRPASAEARNNYGRALVRLKRYPEAEAALKEAAALAPTLAEPVFNLGVAAEEQKRAAEAEAAYRRTVELDPKFGEAWFRLGNLMLGKAQEGNAAAGMAGPGAAAKAAGAASMEAARVAYAKAVAVNPEYTEARYNLTLTLLQMRRLDEAAAQARILVKAAPDSPQNQFLAGTVASQRGDVEPAEKAFKASLRLDPKCRDCALRLANLQFQAGRLAAAARTYHDLLVQDPSNLEAHYLRGLVLFRQGELKDARQEMLDTIGLKPDHLDALNQAAIISLRLRDAKGAAMFIGRAVDADPGYLAAFRTAESMYAQAGDIQITGSPRTIKLLSSYVIGFRQFFKNEAAARKAFKAMIETEPACTIGWLKLGVLEVVNNHNREGLADLAEAEKRAPADPELYYAVGTAYYNLGEHDPRGEKSPHFRESYEYFAKAVKASPAYPDAWWGMGSAQYRMGSYDAARRSLEQCLKLNPFFGEGYNTLGSVAVRQAELATDPAQRAGFLNEAQQAYQQSLRANPNTETSHYNLAVVYDQAKKYKEAEEEYLTALRLNPRFCVARYRLARMYASRQGWFDKGRAEEAFKQVVACEPGNCEYLYDYGAFFFNSRQFEKAREQWRLCAQQCPEYKPARDGLERLIEKGY